MTNPECPTDAPFSNVFTVERREMLGQEMVATIRQTARAWINARNSTVCFRDATEPPTREQVLAQAVAEGACAKESARDYTGVCVEPMQGGGFMASIEQLDYAFPVSVHELRFQIVDDGKEITDANLIDAARAAGLIAGEVSE
jgi:hypothetical protein